MVLDEASGISNVSNAIANSQAPSCEEAAHTVASAEPTVAPVAPATPAPQLSARPGVRPRVNVIFDSPKSSKRRRLS